MTTRCTELDTPVGRILLAASAEGLTHLLFADADGVPLRAKHRPGSDGSSAAARHIEATCAQLSEYFDGRRTSFDVPMAAAGTAFQRAVWSALGRIPYGAVCSYGELARTLDRPRAVRAVGAANGANPISIVVPCHRVIGQNHRLTGYGGGLDAKRWLLRHEGVAVHGDHVA
jgi:methylated-DNA-[protein]-cysteine S-methyltransferase